MFQSKMHLMEQKYEKNSGALHEELASLKQKELDH
jgi:hypothetical protein